MTPSNVPPRIAIDHDENRASHVGKTADHRQFFLTLPFEPAFEGPGCEYVARYVFDAAGALLDATIESFGPRATMDEAARQRAFERLLRELGEISYERIEIAPFALERHGVTFGLLVRDPEEDDGELCVEPHPGNVMAFYAPWDGGDYDT